MIRLIVALFLTITLLACEQNASSDEVSDAEELADQLSGDAAGSAADNPLCKLFTSKELSAYVGVPLGRGENAAMGSGCMWTAADYSGDALIQVAPKSYHNDAYLAEGYKKIPDIGEAGNVYPAMGGWIASAIIGEETVIASVSGDSVTAAQAEALLREMIRRRAN